MVNIITLKGERVEFYIFYPSLYLPTEFWLLYRMYKTLCMIILRASGLEPKRKRRC